MNYLFSLACLLTLIHTLQAAPAPDTFQGIPTRMHQGNDNDIGSGGMGCPTC
ncbi:hypothetical protein PGT21_018838 [Puccinia graminis f. sp. tritici]|uniref:Secreted protein n=1 Tax=Puccinia graminis f. sp. tritici TaxID=56615 RepID=A0A5B0S3H2_PUCGR|nr:hypothetical protein PGT21_018838 [Puccinia graminis f. sp. tritici]KAA1131925.1 hypothetical protein PGTUg99_033878 [Puccinia graminis f. sp. tritici]